DALDRRRRHLRRAPGPCGAPVLADIEEAVGAEHAGVRRPGDIGELPGCSAAVDGRQLAAVALDDDDAAIRQHGRPLGPAEPGGDDLDRKFCALLHAATSPWCGSLSQYGQADPAWFDGGGSD